MKVWGVLLGLVALHIGLGFFHKNKSDDSDDNGPTSSA
jgi:hypothetical protein